MNSSQELHANIRMRAIKMALILKSFQSSWGDDPQFADDYKTAQEILGILSELRVESEKLDEDDVDSPEYEAGVQKLLEYFDRVAAVASERLAEMA